MMPVLVLGKDLKNFGLPVGIKMRRRMWKLYRHHLFFRLEILRGLGVNTVAIYTVVTVTSPVYRIYRTRFGDILRIGSEGNRYSLINFCLRVLPLGRQRC